MSNVSRRKFMITAGVTAAGTLLTNACSDSTPKAKTSASPSASPAATTTAVETPEVTAVKLGFIALTDSAPLIIAKEKGLFAKYGMKDVEVVKQASWAVTRDNLELGGTGGGIDGAHILSPMPYLMAAGLITKGGQKVPMYVLARLNLNGQGMTLSNDYKDLKIGLDSKPLKEAFSKAKAGGKSELKCAVTFPGGTHDLWMRYWLAAGGIDPNQDVSTIVVPPPQMVANIKVGNMEAFCVGEPWPAQAVSQSLGYTAFTTGEMWKDHPEKAFTMRADWVDKNPKAAKAVLMAVQEAQMWCDKPENKEEMCKIVSGRQWFKVPVEDILERSKGNFDMGVRKLENSPLAMKFWADSASYPYQSHDLWFLTEDSRWGYIPADLDKKALIKQVNREDIWQAAAKAIGQEAMIPKSTSRGVETFFDGVKFDPEKPEEYLAGLKIKKA